MDESPAGKDDVEAALGEIARERARLEAQRVSLPSILARAVLYAIAAAVVLSAAGYILTNDPWFGGHAELVCPGVCDDCVGPYRVEHGVPESQARDPLIECSHSTLRSLSMQDMLAYQSEARIGVPLMFILASGAFVWLVLALLFTVPITLAVDVGELRDRRRDRLSDLDDREAELERKRHGSAKR